MRLYFIICFLVSSVKLLSQECFEGKPHPMPSPSAGAKKNLEAKLAEAQKNYKADSSNADNIIWLGRRKAYLGYYTDAIRVFDRGIMIHPDDARMYRHRGHRYITLRCFDKAIADLEKAAELTRGKKDEVEPDGIPNEKNIPTSTLQSNTWYHLGLAYYLQADHQKAYKAYKECLTVSANPDMYVATANWLYITMRKLGKEKEAATLLATIHNKMEIIENSSYHRILLLYKEELSMKDYETLNAMADATTGFAVGNYFLLSGEKEKAAAIFRKVVEGDQWSSFGYIAAEVFLNRMKHE